MKTKIEMKSVKTKMKILYSRVAIAHRLKQPDVGDAGSSDNSGIERQSDEEFDKFEEF